MFDKVANRTIRMIVIGTSAGGVEALVKIVRGFKTTRLACAIVIHLPADAENLIPALLSDETSVPVREASSGEPIEEGSIYIAPPDYHLCLEPNRTLSLSSEELVNFSRPSIDILFESAAFAFQKELVGILLTGANHDGASGMRIIQKHGGVTVVQKPEGIDYPTMPQAALELIAPDYILNLEEITDLISYLCRKECYYGT